MAELSGTDGFSEFDFSGLSNQLTELGDVIRRELSEPMAEVGDELSSAFSRAMTQVENALRRAAQTGEFSFKQMVNAIIADLSSMALDRFVIDPISDFINSVFSNAVSFGGGRAIGGPVSPNQAYLVGEQGPELFVPSSLGRIEPGGRAGRGIALTVNINSPDADGFKRSEQQVASVLARAVRRGTRGL